MRSGPKVKTTSSDVISSPLWNFTPLRSDSSTVRSSMRFQLSARPGIGFELLLQVARDQVLEDRLLHALADIGALAHHLERGAGRHLLHGDGDGRPVVGLADGEARQDQAAGGQADETTTINWAHDSSCPSRGDYGGVLLQHLVAIKRPGLALAAHSSRSRDRGRRTASRRPSPALPAGRATSASVRGRTRSAAGDVLAGCGRNNRSRR